MTLGRTGHARRDGAAPPSVVGLVRLLVALLCAATVASIGAAAAAAAPGEVVWRDFSQRAAGGEDAYASLTVSPTGAVCAVGSTATSPTAATDVLVRAYGAGGGVLWRRVWTWPGHGDDAASAVVRDRRGASVVVGSSGANWLLLKYNRSGYLQWVRRANSRFARCALVAVVVDGDGNVYATGRATPSEGVERILTLKYSSSGKFRWLKTYASAAGDSAAAGITLGGGAVYVAGTSLTGTGPSSAVLLKYSTGGTGRWARTYAGPSAEAARATALAYTSGPVVCGWTALPGGDRGFVALYSAAGEPAWSAGCEALAVTGHRFEALAVDGAGRTCVAGTAVMPGGDQAFSAGFDPTGLPLWTLPGAGTRGFAVCRSADGFTSSAGTAAIGAARATASGAPVWERTLTPAGFSDFRPVALRAAGDEYLYAAGSAAADGGGRAAMLVRYRP
jgi:hypothetical protein